MCARMCCERGWMLCGCLPGAAWQPTVSTCKSYRVSCFHAKAHLRKDVFSGDRLLMALAGAGGWRTLTIGCIWLASACSCATWGRPSLPLTCQHRGKALCELPGPADHCWVVEPDHIENIQVFMSFYYGCPKNDARQPHTAADHMCCNAARRQTRPPKLTNSTAARRSAHAQATHARTHAGSHASAERYLCSGSSFCPTCLVGCCLLPPVITSVLGSSSVAPPAGLVCLAVGDLSEMAFPEGPRPSRLIVSGRLIRNMIADWWASCIASTGVLPS